MKYRNIVFNIPANNITVQTTPSHDGAVRKLCPNELSVNIKYGQSDRRTFADKDKVPRYQTLGNDDKDAMLDFHQSEDKCSCYSYVTSLVIIKLTFVVFAQTEYTISCYFSICSISFVAFVRVLYSHIVEQECLFGTKRSGVKWMWWCIGQCSAM